MKRIGLFALALIAACSSADLSAPSFSSAKANGDSTSTVAPTLAFDHGSVVVKLSTNRKGAQWTAPKLMFRRGTALPDTVTIALSPGGSCAGAGGVYARTGAVRTRAADTTFDFPFLLCVTHGADTTYRAGTFTLTATSIVGLDTLKTVATVIVK